MFNRNIYLVLIVLLFSSCNLFTEASCKEISPAAPFPAEEVKTSEDLINLLEKTDSEQNRKEILEKHKEFLNAEMVIALLRKAEETFYEENGRSRKIIEIAGEVSEFTGDEISLAKTLLYKANFEILEKKECNPPSFQKALSIFQKKGDKKGEGACYLWQAYGFYYTMGDYHKAMEELEKSAKIFDALNEPLYIADCSYSRGILYAEAAMMDRAIENFKKALDIYEKHGKTLKIVNSYRHIITSYRMGGYFDEAFSYLEKEKEIIDTLDDKAAMDDESADEGYNYISLAKFHEKSDIMMDYYMLLGNMYNDTGRYEDAIKSYKKALESGEKITKKNTLEMTVYKTLSSLYLTIGKKDMALKYLSDAVNEETDTKGVWLTYVYLGGFYLREMKQPDEAMKYYQIALEKSKYIEVKRFRDMSRAACLSYIARVFEEKGEIKQAVDKMEESRKAYENVAAYYDYAKLYLSNSYDMLGEVYLKNGDRDNALSYFTRAVEVAENPYVYAVISGDSDIVRAYKCLGKFYFDTEQFDKAIDAYEKTFGISKEEGTLKLQWEIYYVLGKIYEKENKPEEAFKAYRNSIEIIENMRNEFKVEELKRDFMQDKIEVYEHMIDLLMKTNKVKEAFDYNEKARARAFLDILANQKVDIHHGVDPALIEKEEKLKNRIQYLSGDIMQEKAKTPFEQRGAFIDDNSVELEKLKTEYSEVLEEIKLQNPEYMSFISVSPSPIEKIQNLLDEDTVILEYFLGKERCYLWVIGNKSFNTVVLNHSREEIDSLVRSYRDMVCDNITVEKLKSNKFHDLSKKLYSILLKEGEKYIKDKKRIVLSPHRVLYYLPFHALVDDKDRFLIEKYEIVYLPSASVLKYCQSKNKGKKESLMAFELGNVKIGEASALPRTEAEVKIISSYFPQKEIYGGMDMKTDVLYSRGNRFDVLHFATHGILDSSSPLFSSLLFSDRKLNVYEIFNLNLNAYLVVLSACKTGLCEEANGDELVGLSRAFIYAGTPTICSSLWDVSDISTSELMERFYYYLKEGKTKSEALRLAELEIMKKYPHPFFWAPFILTGDWR